MTDFQKATSAKELDCLDSLISCLLTDYRKANSAQKIPQDCYVLHYTVYYLQV